MACCGKDSGSAIRTLVGVFFSRPVSEQLRAKVAVNLGDSSYFGIFMVYWLVIMIDIKSCLLDLSPFVLVGTTESEIIKHDTLKRVVV